MAKAKTLQKVTDIRELKTIKDVKTFVKNNPERSSEVLEKLENLLNKSYSDKLGLEHEIIELVSKCYLLMNDEDTVNFVRNATYETNHTIIAGCIHNYILDNGYFPSIMTIKKETGLSRRTVYNHLNNGFKNKFNSIVKGKIEYMIPEALERLYFIGIKDRNVTALKHFIELSGFTSKNNTTNVNNYIQINNLKLSKDEFEQLPNETILQIENIISKTISK